MFGWNPTTVAPWVPIFNLLLAIAIGGTTVYIAWQQWKGNRLRLTLDRYDQRLHVYREVIGFLDHVTQELKPDPYETQRFRRVMAEAVFLFDAEIPAYLNELYRLSERTLPTSVESGYG